MLLILAGASIASITGYVSLPDNAKVAVDSARQDTTVEQNMVNKIDALFKEYLPATPPAGGETPLITTATGIHSKTTEYQDAKGNKIVVPGGFKVRTDLATTVDKGIVIEDSTGDSNSTGNQFVWVPIGTITKSDDTEVTIEFGRYNFHAENHDTPVQYAKNGGWNAEIATSGYGYDDSYAYTIFDGYTEEPTTEGTNREAHFAGKLPKGNATALNLEKFITTSITNGGYYIARYEASFGSGDQISSVTNGSTSAGIAGVTNQKPYFKQSTSASESDDMGAVTSTPGMLWNNIRQGDASLACRNLYAGNEYNNQDFVQCDLVNSYAWDTAIVFIEKCSGKTDYSSTLYGNETVQNTGESSDNPCNIYDMSGNLDEWSTESSTGSQNGWYLSEVMRGGYSYGDDIQGGRRYSFYRVCNPYTGFRGVLYVL